LILSRGSVSVDIIARHGLCKYYRVTKTEARRRKPPERQFCYSTELPKQKRGGTNQKTEARRRKPKKQKRGGTNKKNRSAAAQAARKTILLFHHLVRPLALLGFC